MITLAATMVSVSRSGKKVTLRDVAREAGVSIKTASRVVNDEPFVHEATAARVAGVVDRLGYKPNELARGLKGQRSHTIGLVVADVSNPFMATCAQAIEAVAREHGHALILCDSHAKLGMEGDYVGLLTQRQVDGLLIAPAHGRGPRRPPDIRAAGGASYRRARPSGRGCRDRHRAGPEPRRST